MTNRFLTKSEVGAIDLAKEIYLRHAALTEEALEAVMLVYQLLSMDNPNARHEWERVRHALFAQRNQTRLALDAFDVPDSMVAEVVREESN